MIKRTKEYSLAPWGEREERLWALVALSLTRPEKSGVCIDDETLAAFHEGRLSKTEEETLRRHVAECAECYERWLEAYDWVPKPRRFPLLGRVREFMQNLLPPKSRAWFGAIGAMAAACLILTFTFLFSKPSGLVLNDWTGAELRSLVAIAPGGVVPKVPAGQATSSRIRGFPLTDLPLSGEDLAAFTSGVRLAASKLADTEPSWQVVVERLSTQAPSHPKREESKERQEGREFLEALGYWSALVAVACETMPPKDEVLSHRYLQERQKQLHRLWLKVQESQLPVEVKKVLEGWVQEAANSRGRGLCRLKPVVLARELLSGPPLGKTQ